MFRRDVETVYESLFLRAVVGFEQFCEALFFDIVNRRVRYAQCDVEPWIKQCPPEALRGIVFQGDNYLDWIPYPRSLDRSNLFMVDGKPFSNLDPGERSKVQTIVTIRNAISHSSEHSQRTFIRSVIGNQPLLPRERTPAGFLRSPLTTRPAIRRRFEVYVGDLGLMAAKIAGTPRWIRRTTP